MVRYSTRKVAVWYCTGTSGFLRHRTVSPYGTGEVTVPYGTNGTRKVTVFDFVDFYGTVGYSTGKVAVRYQRNTHGTVQRTSAVAYHNLRYRYTSSTVRKLLGVREVLYMKINLLPS